MQRRINMPRCDVQTSSAVGSPTIAASICAQLRFHRANSVAAAFFFRDKREGHVAFKFADHARP